MTPSTPPAKPSRTLFFFSNPASGQGSSNGPRFFGRGLALHLVWMVALGMVLTAGVGGCSRKHRSQTQASGSQETYQWKMVTSWPPNSPILGEAAERIARNVEKMSNGRMTIRVYGGGELAPPMGVFDAVRQGTVEMGHSAAYYWAGTNTAFQFFTTIPFGMTAQQMNSWLYSGGGLELWRDLYAKYNLVPFPGGNTGVQMGGWFRKEINTVQDIKGLKMRIPGLGGRVIDKLGGTVVLQAGAEVFPSLERGVIDAAEWLGPYHDERMGLYQAAKFYYYPAWHEPGANLEMIVNKPKYDNLPEDMKAILNAASAEASLWMLSEQEARNKDALLRLKAKGVQIKPFPAPLIQAMKTATEEILREEAAKNPDFKQVMNHYQTFQTSQLEWGRISEKAYQNLLP